MSVLERFESRINSGVGDFDEHSRNVELKAEAIATIILHARVRFGADNIMPYGIDIPTKKKKIKLLKARGQRGKQDLYV